MVYNFIISVGQICSFVLLCIVLSAVVTGTNTRLCVAYPGLYLFVVVQVILLSLLVIMAFQGITTLFVRNVSFWYMHCLICSISLDQTGRGETVAFPPVWWWIKQLRCQLVHTVSFNGVCLHNRNDVKHMKFTRHLSGKAVFWNKHRRKKQEAGCPLYIEYS